MDEHITVKYVTARPDQLIHMELDGVALNGAERPQVMIPLKINRREHYVEVGLSYGASD